MKGIRKVIFLFLVAFSLPLFFYGCGNQTFENVPYSSTSVGKSEVVENVTNIKNNMLDILKFEFEIKTTNTYTFYDTYDGVFSKKTIKEKITTLLGKKDSDPSIAIVKTERFLNNSKKAYYSSTVTYVNNSNLSSSNKDFCYTNQVVQDKDEKGSDILVQTKRVEEYDKNVFSIDNLFQKVFFIAEDNQVNSVLKKEFENVNYYKLSSSTSGLNNIIKEFDCVSVDEFVKHPQAFVRCENGFLKDFSCEYGISSSNYLKYFALNYALERNIESQLETFFKVSSVSRITKNVDSIPEIVEPEDKEDYVAETFIDILSQKSFYLNYKKHLSDTNDMTVSVYKFDEKNISYVNKNYVSGSLLSTNYFVQSEEYPVDLQEMSFDKTLQSKTQIGDEEYVFLYGSNANTQYKVRVLKDKVCGLTIKTNDELLVSDYGKDIEKHFNVSCKQDVISSMFVDIQNGKTSFVDFQRQNGTKVSVLKQRIEQSNLYKYFVVDDKQCYFIKFTSSTEFSTYKVDLEKLKITEEIKTKLNLTSTKLLYNNIFDVLNCYDDEKNVGTNQVFELVRNFEFDFFNFDFSAGFNKSFFANYSINDKVQECYVYQLDSSPEYLNIVVYDSKICVIETNGIFGKYQSKTLLYVNSYGNVFQATEIVL